MNIERSSAMAPPEAPALSPLKRAFLALEEAQSRLSAMERAAREPIAVIGLGCRVPGGGNDAESFWNLMRDGVDAIGPMPADRWDVDALYDPDPEVPGRIATRAGGFIGPVDQFDAGFFGIAPREAQGMDPQQRLLLEVGWEALENAGQAPDRLEGSRTGVYIGMCASDYAYLQLMSEDRSLLDAHFTSGIAHSIGSGRLSYLLGLQGPSVTLDTACSSSLVAVHLACQALRAGDCRMALAGGVNLILSPDLYIALSHSRMLAPDGRCKTFDASADGFARGEGCGVVVLKRLCDAQADGDRVLAVIRGSAVNQDGPSSGLTAPNGPAQEAVIREALANAGVAPREVGYIEAHGTGTQLGDPLEVQALGAVFGQDREQPLWLGSVKTNIGHLEAAAGVTGLIKLVLALRQREIPPHLHFRTPSPHIPWDDFALRVPTTRTPWQPIGGRRIAGVSSFGFSGTNVHVVLEEAPEADLARPQSAQRQHAFVLSARDETALAALARRHASALAGRPDEQLADACFTAAVGRAPMPQRAVVLARSMDELCQGLTALAEGRSAPGLSTARLNRRDPARIAFLFTGQGAQYPGMAKTLYDREPVFRRSLDECAALLSGSLERPLLDVIFASEGQASALDETAYTQPALFAVEYALAQLWRTWGVAPDMVMGHSVGELVAACVAGVMPLGPALALIAERGRLMQSLPAGGAMAAIFASEVQVAEAVAPHANRLAIAALNGAQQTVISGTAEAVDAVCELFVARGVRCQKLPVSHAFHSPLVNPILDTFERAAAAVPLAKPRLRLVSNLSGQWADAAEVTQSRYWRRHVREAVRFADGLRTLASLSPDICIEVGPHPTLLALAEGEFGETGPALVPTLRKGRDDADQLAESLGALFLAGAALDWRAVWASSGCRVIDLPSYPFQRERHWFHARATAAKGSGRPSGHPLLGVRLRSAARDVVSFERVLGSDDLPFLVDHQVNGRAILPATGFIEMALAAGRQVWGSLPALQDVVISEPLAFAPGETRTVQVLVRQAAPGQGTFEVLSQGEDEGEDDTWHLHVQGAYAAMTPPDALEAVNAVLARCTEALDGATHYARLDERHLTFGPSLQGVRGIHRCDGEGLGEIALPASAGAGDYVLHPALLDACLQVMAAALPESTATGKAYLPMSIEQIRVHRSPPADVSSHVRVQASGPAGSDTLKASVTVFDAQGLVATLEGIALRAAAGPALPFYEVTWQPENGAAWLPTPAQLADQAGPLLDGLAREHKLDDYQQAFLSLEAMSAAWIVRALAELGWAPQPGDRVKAEALSVQLGVAAHYHRLMPRLLAILAEDGLLRADAGGWTVLSWPTLADPMAEVAALVQRHPASRPRITLTAQCGEVLGGILRGTVDPLHRLFPDGSAELAEALYRDAPEARAYNQLVRETVAVALRRLPAGQRLRIFEVGGGTGGTTAWLAPSLPADRCEYLFTDIGPLMVARAREKFASHGFMRFQALDLEQDLAAQGLGERHFDIVIASNVIHATADLRRTLGQVRDVLAPGGTLLMLEVAGMERWIDITFGLTDGWWRFTDTDLRPDYPLLSRERWLHLLEALGFEAAAVDAPDPRSREVLLAARKPVDAPVAFPADGRWLVLADAGGVGDALAQSLRAAHLKVELLPAASVSAPALRQQLADGAPLRGVVHLGSLDVAVPSPLQAGSLIPSQTASLGSLLELVQALGVQSFESAPRLWVATRGAQAVQGIESLNVAQSPVWGLGKVMSLEHPEWRTTCIDLDPQATTAAQATALLQRLASPDVEDQWAVRGHAYFVARLAAFAANAADTGSVRLEKADSGVLDDMALHPMTRRAPGPGEVEIRVLAAGLNFRDIMNAVAMRADPEPLGGECAGRVVAVGEGVSDYAVGDAVVATGEACFATTITTEIRHVAPLPRGLSYAQAATLPFAFMTAYHALHVLGGLRAGMSVLIHAGAGGVGMAAIQLAQRAGAVVFATAGSDDKRETLRSLGVAHVLNSRTLDFADEIERLTQGRGVDLVLNSLAGDFIAASVRCLAAEGRFLEIGKRDIWTEARFLQERPRAQYHAIDLNAQRHQDPVAAQALFVEVMRLVGQGELRPLPLHAFPLERGGEAFRFMAQARHTGKVVLIQHDAYQASMEALSPDASYLVTGGLSGLGLITAVRLAAQGARHLVLAGRRAPAQAALVQLDALRVQGVQIKVQQADMSRADEVARVLASIGEAHPLRGVVHSAGVLEDGALQQQTWERFVRPLGPKVDGAWALHVLTQEQPLDFFVMYSSIASVLGSSGQGNHAAANAFMDALAAHRRAQGLPGLSIGWGAWSEVGAAADRQVDQRISARGIDVIAPQQGLDMLQALMRSDAVHVGVLPVRWDRFLEAGVPPFLERFRAMARSAAARAVPVAQAVRGASLVDELRQASPARRAELLLAFVGEHVARVVDAPSAKTIDPRQPLNELGLDSLMAVDLRNRLSKDLGLARSLPATLVFDYPTLEALAGYIEQLVLPAQEAAPVAAEPADAVEAIDDLSDEEIEALFAKKTRRP